MFEIRALENGSSLLHTHSLSLSLGLTMVKQHGLNMIIALNRERNNAVRLKQELIVGQLELLRAKDSLTVTWFLRQWRIWFPKLVYSCLAMLFLNKIAKIISFRSAGA